MVTTNVAFGQSPNVFAGRRQDDNPLLDRLTDHCEVIETSNESGALRAALRSHIWSSASKYEANLLYPT
ncbi:hypothetical protein [Mesorhizobium sp. L-8-3]|uniref:hypothetical protein n=1 Tax=Mesorhizobium sp. L-8-3 TaxID=2744522 RepID=UPI00237B71A4|nr:hypothetical protein [Mesorhizobium sp. L-8-3]